MDKRVIDNLTSALSDEKALKEYRPIPFWSWNDKLDVSELRRQIRWMKEQGFGGYFMHARSGLITDYLSNEWFDCIEACIDEGKKVGLDSWAYDENGWPSGFVGGKLLEEEQNCDKYLSYKVGDFDKDAFVSYRLENDQITRVISGGDGEYLNVYENTSISTADVLNPEVVDKFINLTHEQYKEKLDGAFSGLKGFFTDEPQYFRHKQPYTDTIKKYFRDIYGQDILDGIGLLFVEKKGYKEFRYRYWKGMQELLLNNFAKKIYNWCVDNGCEFTGHYIEERTLELQMMCCAGVMPFYEYQTMPGIDHLGRGINSPAKPKQVSSVAKQLGKKRVLTETFAGCGWDVFPKTLKRIAEWQYVNGVNVMCHHLLPYSERGNRKRDYPAHFSWANPWVRKNIKSFNDYFARLGYLLGESDELVNVAIFCPIRSVYLEYKRDNLDKGSKVNASYLDLTLELAKMHVPYHLLDETIMAKHAKVENGKLIVGKKSYGYVVFPETLTLDKKTAELFEEFFRQGGKLLFTEKAPTYIEAQPHEYQFRTNTDFEEIIKAQEYFVDDVHTEVQATIREIDGVKFIFAVNLSDKNPQTLTFNGDFGSFTRLNLETLETQKISKKVHFDAGESFVLFLDDGETPFKEKSRAITIDGEYEVLSDSGNYLTLDRLSYSVDGVNYSKPLNHLAVFDTLLKERYAGDLYLKYTFDVEKVPKCISFLAEDMNSEWCEVNGKKIVFDSFSDFDKGVLKADISSLVKKGENVAVIKINYFQSDDVYFALFNEKATESLRNKLVYNTNVEACYLQGDFGVFSRSGLLKGERQGVWYGDNFYIAEKKKFVTDMVLDGYPFFAGEIMLKKNFTYSGGDCVININGNYGYAEVYVNDKRVFKPYFDNRVDVTSLVKKGENQLKIVLYTGNKNLLGPHHGVDENFTWASPDTYMRAASASCDERYLFAETTIL